ncbi:MAG TPA: AAA family ATPase [Candidatus Sulfotelmatobacter sp.]|nr:AAA family ATPase [Candidatus Sulfotelmatobacter sp.]
MKHRVGLAYLPGALPCFEEFGDLPTDIVREDGIIQGKPASEILDLMIIPGGSLVESGSLKPSLTREILRMAETGKFVLGICSGLQILSKATDIGRLAAEPIFRQGLGLLDAEFTPLVCTDRVSATIVGQSFMTNDIGATVTGFHCHTYGKLVVHDESKPILISHIQRANYKSAPQDLISGVTNKEGNIVGILMHALLDRNPSIIQSVTKSLDISPKELETIRQINAQLKKEIKREVGVSTNVKSPDVEPRTKQARILLVTATGSGSGKTFVVTGVAGALKKSGLNVSVIKVGGDIRDLVPALYLVKEPIRDYSSIKIGESGWTPFNQALSEASQNHDFIIIEGAMNAFTGLFNEKPQHPTSTVEVARALNVPTILIVASDKEGIEGAVVNAFSYTTLMKKLGIRVKGVIFNKAKITYLSDEMKILIERVFSNLGVQVLGFVPRIDLEGRGMIPEVEIRYEDFGARAIETIEKSVKIKTLAKQAEPLGMTSLNHGVFLETFKRVITADSEFKPQQTSDEN